MPFNSLQDLISNRKVWLDSTNKNKFNLDNLLAKPYSDPAHFIFELLQNADDAGATEVEFELKSDCFVMRHNAKKNFDLKDIEGVTGIGNSQKKDELMPIGKFGLGFKSVFAVTNSPIIYSGIYRIMIKDFVLPIQVDGPLSVDGTQIILPFNNPSISAGKAYEIISRMLIKLEPRTIMFLNNIKEIRRISVDFNEFISKSTRNLNKLGEVYVVKIVTHAVKEDYLIFYKHFNIDGAKLKVEIAYKLGRSKSGKEFILPLEQTSKLVVYLPTEKETLLNFIIQGPYKTTPNRENITLEEEKNERIINVTSDLVADSIYIVKKMGLLNAEFFKTLPIESEKVENYIYNKLYERIKDEIITGRLIPTLDNKYGTPSEIAIPKNNELVRLLKNNDLWVLFSKKRWINIEMQHDSNISLRKYLINVLGVKEIDNDDFSEAINEKFLSKKSDNWLHGFYAYLIKYPSLWKEEGYRSRPILKYKAIIRLSTGEMYPPFDSNGKLLVYLPSKETTRYRTVKKDFMNNINTEKFLKDLGLTEPDIFSEIDEYILPKYVGSPLKPDQDYVKDLLKLMMGYEKIADNRKTEFAEKLSSYNFLLSSNNSKSEKLLRKLSEVYFPTKELKIYFENSSEVFFVDVSLIENLKRNNVEIFLENIGVSRLPRRIKFEGPASLGYQEIFQKIGNTGRSITRVNYKLDGLGNLLTNLTSDKSVILWNFLLKSLENFSTREAKSFFKGEDTWYYYGHQRSEIDAEFTLLLRNSCWVLNKESQFKKPSDITPDELSSLFNTTGENLDILIKELNFKPDYFSSLPSEDREILELARKIPKEKLIEMAENLSKDQRTDSVAIWTPSFSPDETTTKFSEYIPKKPTNDSSYYGPTEEGSTNKLSNQSDETKMENINPEDKGNIGEWGESYVYKYLKERYTQNSAKFEETNNGFVVSGSEGVRYKIIWTNKNGNRGEGFDFLILKDDKNFEYIEVKTKTGKDIKEIEMTGTQWELARNLFNQNVGDKYSIYIVYNAGTYEPEIKRIVNPFRMWKDGEIKAHPVNLIL